MKRVLIAGVLGGIAMYVWASIAHIALPLGQAGISEIPNEAAVLASMHTTLGESHGLYMFPGMGGNQDMKAYEAKLASTPSGLLIYHPPGGKGMTPAALTVEFLAEVFEALLLAWILAQTRVASVAAGFGVSLAVGLAAAITTNISYWNWYGFPTAYTFTNVGIQLMGFVVAGLVASRMLTRNRPATPAQ